MEATKVLNRLSVQWDVSVAKRKDTGSLQADGAPTAEQIHKGGKSHKRLNIATRQSKSLHEPIYADEAIAQQAVPFAHQAAPIAHQAAPTLGLAPKAAPRRPKLVVENFTVLEGSRNPQITGLGHTEQKPRSKPLRAAFLPKALRAVDPLRLDTAHGWMDSPDQSSIRPGEGRKAQGAEEESRAGPKSNKADSQQDDAEIKWLDEIPRSSRGDPALKRARERNARRLREATASDCKILGKYLPAEVSVFFPFGLVGPDDFFQPDRSWVNEVLEVARSACLIPGPPHIRLGLDQEDLDHNTDFLAECDWDMEEVFRRHTGTTAYHGSEFRPVGQLRRIVGQHPGFAYLEEMLTLGFDYHLGRELTEQERIAELQAQLGRGNHKSALQNMEEVRALLSGDVQRGFILPIRADAMTRVQKLHLQPGGMVRQLSLKADGSRQPKSRFTHDLSFSITREDASVNSRVDMSKHPDMVYGWCLLRLLHYIAALRYRNPGVKIFISKFDYSDAYKRISQSPRSSAASVICFGEVAYICWRMVFGGSPNPAGFSGFSEMLTDLANEIAMSDYSAEDYVSPSVRSSHLEVRETEGQDTSFEAAIMPAFEVPTRSNSIRDCFIDDIIDCHLDKGDIKSKAGHIVQMAVHVMSRPHAGNQEPVPRKPLLGPEKLEAEGRSSERQIVLGWEIRTRDLKVALPFDKHLAWREDLVSMIKASRVSRKDLESMIGRLNHASFLIPLSRHFLNELRLKCERSQVDRSARQTVRLSEHEIEDLKLWVEFLDVARRGISINILTVRTPTRMAWSDSCPFGLGGYSLRGRAWRIKVPRDCPFYGDDTANNVLEFLGMAISVMLLLQEAVEDREDHPCILVLGDNTSAVSWIFRSGRVSRNSRYYPAVKFIARTVASRALQAGAQICSQHLAGVTNIVADLLSFEGDCRGSTNPITVDCPPDDVLTDRVHKFYSQVVPSGFKIHRLPAEIESFALSVMQLAARSWMPKGEVIAERPKPMVSATLRDAISSVASAFRKRGRASPFHIQNGIHDAGSIHSRIRLMLRGYEKEDPPPRRQKAVTPALLLDLVDYTRSAPVWAQHTADLVVGGYFFAMRVCEFCRTESPGRTRKLTLGDIVFRDRNSRVVEQTDPNLEEKAAFVTICFSDQKNGTKMERRSHRRTGQEILCPVKSWVRVVKRVRSYFRTSDDNSIPVCAYKEGDRAKEIGSSQVLQLLRSSCQFHDGENKYGIKVSELGTRSIRSGAAMALALQGTTSDQKIMTLGRWKSTAFLHYIRPQVLEWAGDTAQQMSKTQSFLDVGKYQRDTKTNKSSPIPNTPLTGEEIPSFTLPQSQSQNGIGLEGRGSRLVL